MKIKTNEIGFFKAICILASCRDLLNTLNCHEKGENFAKEIKSEAEYLCEYFAEEATHDE